MLRLSRCMGLAVPEPTRAARFYQDTLDVTSLRTETSVLLALDDLRLYLDPGPQGRLMFEMITDDMEAARKRVLALGMEVLSWGGAGHTNLVRDPHGLIWNIHWGEPHVESLTPPNRSLATSWMGISHEEPYAAAQYYAQLFQVPMHELVDGTFALSSAGARFRVRRGANTPTIWLSNEADIEALMNSGFQPGRGSTLVDPFGITWAPSPLAPCESAVVSM
ncbi:MAG: VOC family protein [Armatimonadota bacterium]|nr:hypothetical protein [Fimbriimonadaceae bacterium]MCZ8139160.1 hypothetical protein [Fimbriimonadaceae bacterium]HRD32308.1 VOC family protein [Fimbriimonadaceae bacterium]